MAEVVAQWTQSMYVAQAQPGSARPLVDGAWSCGLLRRTQQHMNIKIKLRCMVGPSALNVEQKSGIRIG
eukprot:6467642-Amphidinium_carterae.1